MGINYLWERLSEMADNRKKKLMPSKLEHSVIVLLSYWKLLLSFFAGITGFAYLYYTTQTIAPTFQEAGQKLSFGDCFHFSMETATSLGYGDFRPIGFGRTVSALEVIFGLVFLGIFLSQLTSNRFDYLLSGVYRSEARRRIKAYSQTLGRLRDEYQELLLGDGITDETHTRVVSDHNSHHSIYDELRTTSASLRNFVEEELSSGDFFDDAPISGLREIFHAMKQTLHLISSVYISMDPNDPAFMIMFGPVNISRIAEINYDFHILSTLAMEKSTDKVLRLTCEYVDEQCRIMNKIVLNDVDWPALKARYTAQKK